MQCELTVIVYNGMSCIGTTLKTDNDIRLLCQHICDLSFPSSPQFAPTTALTMFLLPPCMLLHTIYRISDCPALLYSLYCDVCSAPFLLHRTTHF